MVQNHNPIGLDGFEFGLGAEIRADIEVQWPSGAAEKFPAQAADRLVTILEGKGIVPGRGFARI